MKKNKKLKWVRFEYDDEDCNCYQEVLKIKTSNNTDDDCYLTKREMRALFFFLSGCVWPEIKEWLKEINKK